MLMDSELQQAGVNWAGNHAYRAAGIVVPETTDQLREIAATAPKLKVLGSRHSFNDVADSEGILVSLGALGAEIEIDNDARTVSVGGGVRYGELARVLDEHGWAVHNLASLPHISIAGAVATGTHGSGDRNGALATAVRGIEVVTSDGELHTIRMGDADFDGSVVALGALGVVTRVELAIEPSFQVRQQVYLDLPWGAVVENIDAILASAYSVSLFTDWSERGVQQVWQKIRLDEPSGPVESPAELFGAPPADRRMHPIAALDAVSCTEQLGIPGPWFERLPHFRMDFTPSSGAEIQSEYLLPRSRVQEAIEAMRPLSAQITPLLLVSEIRSMRADRLWLSEAYGRDTVAFHFTWIRDGAKVQNVLPLIEDALRPYEARPHWGKVFVSGPDELNRLYPELPRFRELAGRMDPRGAFRNAFTDRYVFTTD
jgi:alditol oxidase